MFAQEYHCHGSNADSGPDPTGCSAPSCFMFFLAEVATLRVSLQVQTILGKLSMYESGAGTQITPKLHPVLITHALVLQTSTHTFLPCVVLLTEIGLRTLGLDICVSVCRTGDFYCTVTGSLHEEGLVHSSLTGD